MVEMLPGSIVQCVFTAVESCAERVNPRGLRVPALRGGSGNPHCYACAAGAG